MDDGGAAGGRTARTIGVGMSRAIVRRCLRGAAVVPLLLGMAATSAIGAAGAAGDDAAPAPTAATSATAPPGIDPTFATAGVRSPLLGETFVPRSVAVTTGGRILVGGSRGPANTGAVVALTSSGTTDTTFGTAGTTPIASDVVSVLVRADGRILVVGVTHPTDTTDEIVLTGLLANGVVDTAFGTSGRTTTTVAVTDRPVAAVLQSTGAVVLASAHTADGAGSGPIALRRYTAAGALDATFGTGGVTTVTFGGANGNLVASLAGFADDSLLVVGRTGTDAGLVRDARLAVLKTDASGVPDATFGTAGVVRYDAVSVGHAAVARPDGRVVVTGEIEQSSSSRYPQFHPLFVGLTATGALDPAFDGDGVIVVPLRSGYSPSETVRELLPWMVRRSDGTFVAAGGNLDAVRLRADGAVDTTFGLGGKVHAPFPDAVTVTAAAVDGEGRLVAASDNRVVRYRAAAPTVALTTATRVLDTRRGTKPDAGTITRVDTGRTGRDAVFANITLTDAPVGGYATAGPCSTMLAGPQEFSNGNAAVATARANLSLVRVDPDGAFCIFTQQTMHLVVDVQGTVGDGTDLGVIALGPRRIADTRTGLGTKVAAGTIVRVGTRRELQSGDGRDLAPPGTRAVLVNLTTVGAEAPGYLTADRCDVLTAGAQRTSTANATPGTDLANGALVPVDDNGDLCIYAQTTVHVIVDVTAALVPTGGNGLYAVATSRIHDTRSLTWLKPGPQNTQALDPSTVARTVPSTASGILANVTATNARAAGYITIYGATFPSYGAFFEPEFSTVNHRAGENTANTTALRSGAQLWAYTSADTDVLVDVQGVW